MGFSKQHSVSLFVCLSVAGAMALSGCVEEPITPDVFTGGTGGGGGKDAAGTGGTGGVDAFVDGDSGPQGCTSDDDCSADDPCMVAACTDDGTCTVSVAVDGTPCEDGQECTAGDACTAGECVGGPVDPGCEEPCSSNDDCGDGEFCQADECGGPGDCEPMPTKCDADYTPVCGCDGQTYSNACAASASGVSVADKGQCDCPQVDCGAGTSAVDSNGDGCTDTCKAQCEAACDCYANQDIGFEGECPLKCLGCGNYWACDAGYCQQQCGFIPEDVVDCAEPTGCQNNKDCGDGEYCAKADGNCDGLGKCSPSPEVCPKVYTPVCGCNGETFGNACEAASQGFNVSEPGACDDACGGLAGIPCDDGQYCDPPAGACDFADIQGDCVVVPQGCSKELAPVCGCDGMTYGNDCLRLLALVALSHEGPCGCTPVVCSDGATPIDTDGDQCADACVPCPAILCLPGLVAVDVDGDGCDDGCVPAGCGSDTDCQDGEFCAKESCFAQSGKCAVKPEFCTEQYDPVCGCDGETYGNACAASSAGQNINHPGECIDTCGTIAGIPCPSGTWCQHPGGQCLWSDQQGICTDVPSVCPDVWAPVCGCDGQTYGNDCERLTAQVQLDHAGQCSCAFIIDCAPGYTPVDEDGDGCNDACVATTCSSDLDCAATFAFAPLFCAFKDGECGGSGVCQMVPDVCTKEYAPVCGCDGVTYSNACHASLGGTSVASQGACTSVCKKGDGTCDLGSFCDVPADNCFAKDIPGECVEQPDACIALYDPVCGCDGVTYANDCARLMAGVTKATDGACQCGANDDCADTHYCVKGGCFTKDLGTCQPKPDKCTLVYKPVCGCSGTTYSNACFAAAAGEQVQFEGECEPDGTACSDSAECAAGEYCAKADGGCDANGKCQALPVGCTLQYDPVCGCDGKDYGNACVAAQAGVNVAKSGQCSEKCGGFVGAICPFGQWCDPDPDSCNIADGQGDCIVEADCDAASGPVCGCNGKTYLSECTRIAAKVAKAFDGACNCPEIACDPGSTPVDVDGDGCADSCLPCLPILCAPGSVPVDADGDGCAESCEASKCTDSSQCADDEYCLTDVGCGLAGVCDAKPSVCPLAWVPICGCDGVTYGNSCAAAAAGVSVASKGACVELCGGFAGLECMDGGFCQLEAGTCFNADQFGQCEPVPAACPEVWDPVCGCDGVTYGNDCERLVAQAQKDHDGSCGCLMVIDCLPGFAPADEDGDGCDDSCTATACESNADCGPLDFVYCSAKAGCGGGTCALKPDLCTKEYAPVCGCDGVTYGNGCEAALAGANVAAIGPCTQTCGGPAAVACAPGQFCEFGDSMCGVDGTTGQCVAQPDACFVGDGAPVCGCDANTYGNDCMRQLAGVSKAYDGQCKCTTQEDCGKDGYCDVDGCGLVDQPGTCQPKPKACTEEYKPVCGCDGVTYGNACSAAAQAVSVLHSGECDGGSGGCTANTDCVVADGTDVAYCATNPGQCGSVGVCSVKPQGCTGIFAPVCGCDGADYSSVCAAAEAGVNVLHEGACETASGCTGPQDCSDEELCWTETCGTEGTCAPKPAACPEIYAPVCGCSGQTWSSKCEARANGDSVAHVGKCEVIAEGCKSQTDCEDGAYCLKATCTSAAGECAPIPEACPDVWSPICGCDNTTYSNGCMAAAQGVNIAYQGECEPVVTLCFADTDCNSDKGEYCALSEGKCGGFGFCSFKPTACPDIWDPVCGCDQKTWSSTCEAAAAGVNVATDGECESTVKDCTDNSDCDDSSYCKHPTGACAKAGVCVAKPAACPLLVDPVCGCDGVTYLNACLASAAGASVVSAGACSDEPSDCTGDAGCASADGVQTGYCQFEAGACGGVGQCQDLPVGCPDVWLPVCGCNGVTYGNDCEAATAGVSISADGECATSTLCESSVDCGVGTYCFKNAGDCDGKGECAPIGDGSCPEIYAPVCTCDGKTMDNACFAAGFGLNVAHTGACVDGSACDDNTGCPDGSYCAKQTCTDSGLCAPKPTACPDVWLPVCGCDNKTFGNSCEAAAAGVPVQHEGACEVVGNTCTSNEDCAAGTGCYQEWGQCGGAGTCDELPEQCPLFFVPICGCDGVTYSSDCEAVKAGTAVAYNGACLDTGDVCKVSSECDAGSFCHTPDGLCGGEGVCETVPLGCFDLFNPVCGCDGKTWSNSCDAQSAGVSMAYLGVCSCAQILCLPGFSPKDTDGDGCDDECVAQCTVLIDCAPGFAAVDTTGDGCADTCKAPCDATCDCYDKKGNDFTESCPLLCANCGMFWGCVDGLCEEQCGFIPDDAKTCDEPTACTKNAECGTDALCAKPTGSCETPDKEGQCTPTPDATQCAIIMALLPSCGCDGVTYNNDCYAQLAGVNTAHYGACGSDPATF